MKVQHVARPCDMTSSLIWVQLLMITSLGLCSVNRAKASGVRRRLLDTASASCDCTTGLIFDLSQHMEMAATMLC